MCEHVRACARGTGFLLCLSTMLPFLSPASSNSPTTYPATGPGPTAHGHCPASTLSFASIPGSNLPGSGPCSAEASPDATATSTTSCSSPSAGTSGYSLLTWTWGGVPGRVTRGFWLGMYGMVSYPVYCMSYASGCL